MRIFFYRICGTGMGAAACLLQENGQHVEGGDVAFAPPMETYLQSTGIPLHSLDEIDDDFLKSFDLIVVGNVVGKNGPDARRLEGLGVPLESFPSAINKFVLKDRRVVGIAGTHGKTTTTFLALQVFEALGYEPGYFIGGVLEGRPSSRLGSGELFFIESDEYDCAWFEKVAKFRRYNIKDLILTSLEYDHADIYDSLEEIKEQFRSLLSSLSGHFIFCSDYPACQSLQEEFPWLQGIPYGKETSLGPSILDSSPDGTVFQLEGEIFETNVTGIYNIYNLSSILLYARRNNAKIPRLKKAVSQLVMVKRRQEYKGRYRGSLLIDDFAHHPRAVSLTLDNIKGRHGDKHIHAIFEPASATARSALFQEDFARALKKADLVTLVRPQSTTTVKNASDLDLDLLVKKLPSASIVDNREDLIYRLQQTASEQTVTLIMSNAGVLGLWSALENEITK